MLLLASEGDYPEGTAGAAFDFQRPYLDMIFRFMGFTDVRVSRSEGTLGPGAETNQAAAEAAVVAAAGGF